MLSMLSKMLSNYTNNNKKLRDEMRKNRFWRGNEL